MATPLVQPSICQPKKLYFYYLFIAFYVSMCGCGCFFPQRAEPALWCLTVSSSKRRRRCSTTSPSCLRVWSARSASVTTGVKPSSADAPSTSAKRASRRRRGASWTGWSLGTTSAWRSEFGPRAATTWPSSEVTQPAGPVGLKVLEKNSVLLTVVEQQAALTVGK